MVSGKNRVFVFMCIYIFMAIKESNYNTILQKNYVKKQISKFISIDFYVTLVCYMLNTHVKLKSVIFCANC